MTHRFPFDSVRDVKKSNCLTNSHLLVVSHWALLTGCDFLPEAPLLISFCFSPPARNPFPLQHRSNQRPGMPTSSSSPSCVQYTRIAKSTMYAPPSACKGRAGIQPARELPVYAGMTEWFHIRGQGCVASGVREGNSAGFPVSWGEAFKQPCTLAGHLTMSFRDCQDVNLPS